MVQAIITRPAATSRAPSGHTGPSSGSSTSSSGTSTIATPGRSRIAARWRRTRTTARMHALGAERVGQLNEARGLHVDPGAGVEVRALPGPVLARAGHERGPQAALRRRLEVAV